jgi:hypothetical protein
MRDPIERAGDESNDEGWRARWRAGRAGGLGQDWQTRGQERTALAGRAILSVLLMTGVVVAVVTTTSLAEGWTKLLDSGGGSGSLSRSINPEGRAGTIIAGWRFYWLAVGIPDIWVICTGLRYTQPAANPDFTSPVVFCAEYRAPTM